MRFFNKGLLVLALSVITTITGAADITDTYTTGETLTTTTLDNIKSSVNSKQDRVTGACSPGEAIGSINADGTVACETDDDTVYTDGDATTAIAPLLTAIKQNFSAGNHIFTTGITNSILTITVTPPADGYILVTASGEFWVLATGATTSYYGSASISNSSTWDVNVQAGVSVDKTANGNTFKVPLYLNRMEAVTKNIPVTFHLLGIRDGSTDGQFYLSRPKLTALFVPNALP